MNSLYITDTYKISPLKVDYRSLAYPLLLLFITLLIATLRWTGLPLEATLTIAFMASLLMLGIDEILIPFRFDWVMKYPGYGRCTAFTTPLGRSTW